MCMFLTCMVVINPLYRFPAALTYAAAQCCASVNAVLDPVSRINCFSRVSSVQFIVEFEFGSNPETPVKQPAPSTAEHFLVYTEVPTVSLQLAGQELVGVLHQVAGL